MLKSSILTQVSKKEEKMNFDLIAALTFVGIAFGGTGIIMVLEVRAAQLDWKCRNIKAPRGSGADFVWSGNRKLPRGQGIVIKGFLAVPPAEGGPSLKFLVKHPDRLGKNLRIVQHGAAYLLYDEDNLVYYP